MISERGRIDDARVVHQHVDPAEFGKRRSDNLLRGACLGDVGGERADPGEALRGFGEPFGGAADHEDARALPGELVCGDLSDARSAAGDDHGLAFKLSFTHEIDAKHCRMREGQAAQRTRS